MAPIPQDRTFYIFFPPPQPEIPTTLDKIVKVAGIALGLLGLAILIGATFALAGHLMGSTSFAIETIHTFFLTGIVSSIGGFHLAKSGHHSPVEISAGPIAITM